MTWHLRRARAAAFVIGFGQPSHVCYLARGATHAQFQTNSMATDLCPSVFGARAPIAPPGGPVSLGGVVLGVTWIASPFMYRHKLSKPEVAGEDPGRRRLFNIYFFCGARLTRTIHTNRFSIMQYTSMEELYSFCWPP